jgi:predicted RNase H-like nuclease (RuvC/YqgF family)
MAQLQQQQQQQYSNYIMGLEERIADYYSSIAKLENERNEINTPFSSDISASVMSLMIERRQYLTTKINTKIEKIQTEIQKLQKEVATYKKNLHTIHNFNDKTFCRITNTAKSIQVRIVNIDHNMVTLETNNSKQISVNIELFQNLYGAIFYGINSLTNRNISKEICHELFEQYEKECSNIH